jgi:hypothetical protein
MRKNMHLLERLVLNESMQTDTFGHVMVAIRPAMINGWKKANEVELAGGTAVRRFLHRAP